MLIAILGFTWGIYHDNSKGITIMGTYGLKIFDALGNVMLNTDDIITRFRYATIVSAGVSGNVTLSDIDGLDTIQFALAYGSTKYIDVAHKVWRSENTVYWQYQNGINYDSSASIIFVFLYS